MDETSRPEHDRPEGDDTARAPKRMRMRLISYAEMHEDMEPDLSQEAFGGDVIGSLESYDFDIDDETEWDFAGDDICCIFE